MAADQGVPMSQLPLNELTSISEVFGEDVAEVFNFARSVKQRKSFGGTAPESVRAQIARAKAQLNA
jgi:argininosuccinate lyase